ncbi:MAG: lipopolysaccharide kinase InaA family protein [Planctomycetota bacterium]|nr:lipopolysaccharide kinase InaA family protein [Planctomycetota bacterium]
MATLTIHPDYRALLAAAGLDTFDALFAAAGGHRLDGHGSRSVSRLEVPGGEGVGLYVKRYWDREARATWTDLLRFRLPAVPARREYDTAGRLLEAGIEVARPVAWGRRAGPEGDRSLVAFREVEGPSLARWLSEHDEPAASGVAARRRHAIARTVGRAVRNLHRAGFAWPDLYAKHVYLVGKDPDRPRVVFIDVARVRRRLPGRRVRDLAALYVSAGAHPLRRTDAVRFLRAYLGRRVAGARGRRLIRAVRRRADRIPRRGRDPHLIAARRQAPPGMVPLAEETMTPTDGGRLLINEAFRPMIEAAGLTTLDAVMAVDGGRVVREAAGRSTVRLVLADPASGAPRAVYLKRHRRVPWRMQLRRTVSLNEPESFARHEAGGLVRLADLGIASMRPVLLGEEIRRGGRAERSLLATEEIAGATQADDYCEAHFAGPLSPAETTEKRRLIRQIADIARRLHAADLSHRDFYLCHIMVRPVEGREPVLHLIDLQRLTHHRHGIGRRWIVKDLAALLFSSWPGPATGVRSPVFTQADRLRFARAYFQADRLTAEHKRLLRAVVRKARRIARHDARRRVRKGGTP